jgi:hypothetical protein
MQDRTAPWVTVVRIAIAGMTVFTAAIHFELSTGHVRPVSPDLSVMFLLAGMGYLGTLVAAYAPLPLLQPLHRLGRLGLIGVTASTIVAYFVVVGFTFDTVSLVDKLVEAVLLVSVGVETVSTWRTLAPALDTSAPRRAAA